MTPKTMNEQIKREFVEADYYEGETSVIEGITIEDLTKFIEKIKEELHEEAISNEGNMCFHCMNLACRIIDKRMEDLK